MVDRDAGLGQVVREEVERSRPADAVLADLDVGQLLELGQAARTVQRHGVEPEPAQCVVEYRLAQGRRLLVVSVHSRSVGAAVLPGQPTKASIEARSPATSSPCARSCCAAVP